MINVKQIHFVEGHWESIARRAVVRIRGEGVHSHALTEQMILDRAQELFGHLGDWLADPDLAGFAARYEQIGRIRARENVPLHEMVRCMQILGQSAIDYVRENELQENAVLFRSQSELEYRIDRFFDLVIYHIVKGYGSAVHERVRVVGSAS